MVPCYAGDRASISYAGDRASISYAGDRASYDGEMIYHYMLNEKARNCSTLEIFHESASLN